MISSFDISKLPELVVRQLSGFFPVSEQEEILIKMCMREVMKRIELCFSGVDNKYFHRGEDIYFSPYHSGQWLIFLYYLSNTVSTKLPQSVMDEFKNYKELADKVYYLNKIMHSVDIYHEVELPTQFFLEHPLSTVLGRASYKDGFMAYQNCTVGGNKGCYPTLGKNFRMMSGSKILGNSIVGDNVTLAANTYVKDTDLPSGATVFGSSPNLIIKHLQNV